ncbi:MAG: peptidyl-prolyl cis-trans isomerase [Planctomycetaceae bacterium]|nr:peptidyl-prolyl cis-trans isomerase [Planctomycetaceae bacterium]
MGPPPPRLSANDAEQPSEAPTVTSYTDGQTDVQLVTSGRDVLDKVTEESQVVATVNGEPIFAADLLEPYQSGLQRAEQDVRDGKLPAEILEKQKFELMKKGIDGAIERKLLEQGLKKTLKKEQREMIQVFLDQYFEQEVQAMMAKDNIQSKHEFDEHLKKNGFSLASLRRGFESRTMATEYLRAKQGDPPKLTRDELMVYYNEHRDEYTIPERVKWQFLLIEYKKHGGRQGAYAVLNKAAQEIKQGVVFEEVVKKYSDSATRYDGGYWASGDWTTPGSLSDSKVEKALFEMPVGRVSAPFESETDFKMVKVVERQEATLTPFDEVQEEIEKNILKADREKATREVMDELYKNAHIESIFEEAKKIEEEQIDQDNPFANQLLQ